MGNSHNQNLTVGLWAVREHDPYLDMAACVATQLLLPRILKCVGFLLLLISKTLQNRGKNQGRIKNYPF